MYAATQAIRACLPRDRSGLRAPYLLLLPLLLALTACAPVQIQPPAEPDPPARVLLIDHGRHTSLMLRDGDGKHWLRYSYGDWRFYAERRTGPFSALAALAWPTRAALGRQVLTGEDPEAALRRDLRVPVRETHALTVSADDATVLREDLEELWRRGRDDRREMAAWDMAFVEHPVAYSLRHNSNRIIALWLAELEVRVSRSPILSRWEVCPATPDEEPDAAPDC